MIVWTSCCWIKSLETVIGDHVAEWLRPLIFRALNRSSSHCCDRVTYETGKVLLAGGQVVFLRDLPFRTTVRLTQLKMSEIILTGRKRKKKKNKKKKKKINK